MVVRVAVVIGEAMMEVVEVMVEVMVEVITLVTVVVVMGMVWCCLRDAGDEGGGGRADDNSRGIRRGDDNHDDG